VLYLKIFFVFIKMGIFIFGAGHALASVIQQEVISQKWLTVEEYQDGWSIASGLPGPISIKMVVFVGYKAGGILGAIVSTLAYILPCASLMLITLLFIAKFKGSQAVESIIKSIKPVVLALIVVAAYQIFRKGAVSDVRTCIIAITAFGLFLLKVEPVFVFIGAGIIGLSYLFF
jgi:chromate transporter